MRIISSYYQHVLIAFNSLRIVVHAHAVNEREQIEDESAVFGVLKKTNTCLTTIEPSKQSSQRQQDAL